MAKQKLGNGRGSGRCAKAHQHLVKTSKRLHPSLAELICRNGLIRQNNGGQRDLVEFLARTVIGQQLSSQAASTIWLRVQALIDGQNTTAQEFFLSKHFDKLRGCGISASKVKAIVSMNEEAKAGRLGCLDNHQTSYREIVEVVTSLWGFGEWSADMVAIFYSEHPDVWPNGDAALSRALKTLHPGCDSGDVVCHYSPFRTYLARHLWRGLDNKLIVAQSSAS